MGTTDLSKNEKRISAMFNGIASDYDRLNHILSFGIDHLWRHHATSEISASIKAGSRILDIACGTGDLSAGLAKKGFEVVGIDIAENMLHIAEKKLSSRNFLCTPAFIRASAENIPFEDDSFDAVTIAFGIRNFDNRDKCLKEISRVLRKGGLLRILEFAEPRNRLWKAVFNTYFMRISPLIGKAVSKDKEAYLYLPESVRAFPKYENFCNELSADFSNPEYDVLSGGIALYYKAYKP